MRRTTHHAENAWAGVLQVEVFVLEAIAVDRLASSTLMCTVQQ